MTDIVSRSGPVALTLAIIVLVGAGLAATARPAPVVEIADVGAEADVAEQVGGTRSVAEAGGTDVAVEGASAAATTGQESLWVPGGAFISESPDFLFFQGSGCVGSTSTTGSTNVFIEAEVELPHGAQVDSMDLVYFDNDPESGDNVDGALYRYRYADAAGGASPASDELFLVTSTADDGWGIVRDSSINAPGGEVVDTDNYGYTVLGAVTQGEQFCGVEIVYTPPNQGQVLTPVTPCKLYDSRPSQGGPGNPGPQELVQLDLTKPSYAVYGGSATDCGIPEDASALMVSVNILGSTADGGIRFWPLGDPASTAHALAWERGQRQSSAVPVLLNENGAVAMRNYSAGTTQLQIVVFGWYGEQW